MIISIRKSKLIHIHTKTIVSASRPTEADVATLNLAHKCSACAREFTKRRGLRIFTWQDGVPAKKISSIPSTIAGQGLVLGFWLGLWLG